MKEPLLSVIIPVYNEKATILKILEKVNAVDIDKELVIVDDGSNDGTEKILADIKSKSNPRVKVLFHQRNMGKGAAIKTALNNISGDIVAIQDADLETDPNDLKKMIRPIIEQKNEVTFGVREEEGLLYYGVRKFWITLFGIIALRLLNLLTNILYPNKSPISDVTSGYKMMCASLMKSLDLKSNGFEIDAEICSKLRKRRYHIKEVSVKYYPRTYKEGKKIKWWDIFPIFYTLFKYKFTDL